jgi:COP9 signalosome complex subunit 1
MRDNYLLDIYLAPHIRALYSQIRNRGLVQYLSPYASADLNRMAESFNTTIPALENELMELILEGQILARIDSHNKILYAKNIDQRSVTFEKSLQMGEKYERRTKLMILRAAMVKAHIQVKVSQ